MNSGTVAKVWAVSLAGAAVVVALMMTLPALYERALPQLTVINKTTSGWALTALTTSIMTGVGVTFYWFVLRTKVQLSSRNNSSLIIGKSTMFHAMFSNASERMARGKLEELWSPMPVFIDLEPTDQSYQPYVDVNGIRKIHFPIALAGEELARGRHQRHQEYPIVTELAQTIARGARRMANRGRRPVIQDLVCDGASALSVHSEWESTVVGAATQNGAFAIRWLNLGSKLRRLRAERRQEYNNRMLEMLKLVGPGPRPPVIFTTPPYSGGRPVVDLNTADAYFLESVYIIDRTSVLRPVHDDLENLLQPSRTYAILTPCTFNHYSDFEASLKKALPMFPVLDPSHPPIDLEKPVGMVVVSTSPEAVHEFTSAVQGRFPDIKVAAYADESKPRFHWLPRAVEPRRLTAWAPEKLHGFLVYQVDGQFVETSIDQFASN